MTDLTLVLDGATYSSSAALLRDGKLLAESHVADAGAGAAGGKGEALVPVIDQMLVDAGVRAAEITSVICGAGPGSFTSLRVAASVAKGIAFASGAKMYAVSSLLLTVAGMRDALEDGDYLSVLPAMRGELFALPVSVTRGIPTAAEGTPSIVDEASIHGDAGARAIGPGQTIDANPEARGAARLYAAIISSGPIDLDSWEPEYGRLAEAQVKWEAAHGRPLRA